MTPALRKRHQRTWWLLGVALLLIWGTSMIAIQKNNTKQLPDTNLVNKGISIQVVSDDNTNNQLVMLTLNESLASPQVLVYLSEKENTNIENSILLGRIDGKGEFKFKLNANHTAMPTKVITGYDGIHQKELFSSIITTN